MIFMVVCSVVSVYVDGCVFVMAVVVRYPRWYA